MFEEINLRKQKLVWYALDVDRVEFDFSQDPECHGFLLCECWGMFGKPFFLFCLA